MKKYYFLTITILLFVLLFQYQLFINYPSETSIEIVDGKIETFNKLISETNQECKMYLLFSEYDMKELPKGMKQKRLFCCKDRKLLINLMKSFKLKETGGDMATCESKLIFYIDSKLVLSTAFVLTDEIVGIQNQSIGWAEVEDKSKVIEIFKKFEPVNFPIVVF